MTTHSVTGPIHPPTPSARGEPVASIKNGILTLERDGKKKVLKIASIKVGGQSYKWNQIPGERVAAILTPLFQQILSEQGKHEQAMANALMGMSKKHIFTLTSSTAKLDTTPEAIYGRPYAKQQAACNKAHNEMLKLFSSIQPTPVKPAITHTPAAQPKVSPTHETPAKQAIPYTPPKQEQDPIKPIKQLLGFQPNIDRAIEKANLKHLRRSKKSDLDNFFDAQAPTNQIEVFTLHINPPFKPTPNLSARKQLGEIAKQLDEKRQRWLARLPTEEMCQALLKLLTDTCTRQLGDSPLSVKPLLGERTLTITLNKNSVDVMLEGFLGIFSMENSEEAFSAIAYRASYKIADKYGRLQTQDLKITLHDPLAEMDGQVPFAAIP